MQAIPSLSKLNRFLLSLKWDLGFPFSKGLAHLRPVFDPILVVLCGKIPNGEPNPFKFENMWIKSLGLVDMVKRWWESFIVPGKSDKKL